MKQIQNKWNKRIIVMISSVCLFCLTVMPDCYALFNKHLGKSTFYVRAKHAIGLCEKSSC
ncbi:hypothetical protein PM726_07020 [Enterococcus faecium]|jgi:hypothetical protein|nr:hypothetical protein [Enterococcus faecium]MDB7250760.1 hypothetical protein [Enterococcus faecium]MDB7278800.1 hypothetical protein [Enterococcus faecium]